MSEIKNDLKTEVLQGEYAHFITRDGVEGVQIIPNGPIQTFESVVFSNQIYGEHNLLILKSGQNVKIIKLPKRKTKIDPEGNS